MLGNPLWRRLLSTQAQLKIASNVPYTGPLLNEAAKVAANLESTVIPTALIPRRNPFLKPVEAWLRNFQTFRPASIIRVSPHLLDAPARPDIIHRVVTWYLAGRRAGTASSKARGEVAGSNRKIRQQKGTGKARAGSSRAPQRRGGGRVFGPKPRDFSYSLSPKIRALALRSALSAKFRQGQLTFVQPETLQIPSHKTATLVQILENIPKNKKVLLLDAEDINDNLKLASQSLSAQFRFMNVKSEKINAYHVLNSSYLLLTTRALEHLEGWLTKGL